MKRIRKLLPLFCVLILIFCACSPNADSGGKNVFNAKIVSISNNRAIVEPLEGEAIRRTSTKIAFSTAALEDIGAEENDIVTITYIGEVQETYPAHITAVRWNMYKQ